jgi:WD40 repeat protein
MIRSRLVQELRHGLIGRLEGDDGPDQPVLRDFVARIEAAVACGEPWFRIAKPPILDSGEKMTWVVGAPVHHLACPGPKAIGDRMYWIAAAAGNTVRMWNPRTGEEYSWTGDDGESVTSLAFSHDGCLFAFGYSAMAVVWDLREPDGLDKNCKVFQGGDFVSSVAFSPDGRFAFADPTRHSRDEVMVRIWDPSNPVRPVDVLRGPVSFDDVRSIAFSPDGRYLAGRLDRSVLIWNLVDTSQPFRVITPEFFDDEYYRDSVISIEFSPDGSFLVIVTELSSVIFWKLDSQTDQVWPHRLSGSSVAFNPDGNCVALGTEGGVTLVNKAGEKRFFHGHGGEEVTSVAFSADGEIVSAAGDGRVIVRDPEDLPNDFGCGGKEWDADLPLIASIVALAFSADGSSLISCEQNGAMHIWSGPFHKTRSWLANLDRLSPTLDSRCVFEGYIRPFVSMALTQNGATLATLHENGGLRFQTFDSDAHEITHDRNWGYWWGRACIPYPWDNEAATAIESGTRRLAHGPETPWWSPPFQATAIAYTSHSLLVSGSNDGRLKVWDRFGREIEGDPGFEVQPGAITSLAGSSDDGFLAIGSDDGTIRIRDFRKTRRVVHTFEGHTAPVTSLAFSSDEQFVASGSEDRTVRMWEFDRDAKRGHAVFECPAPVLAVWIDPKDPFHVLAACAAQSRDRHGRPLHFPQVFDLRFTNGPCS